jgi:hypothetical protein
MCYLLSLGIMLGNLPGRLGLLLSLVFVFSQMDWCFCVSWIYHSFVPILLPFCLGGLRGGVIVVGEGEGFK